MRLIDADILIELGMFNEEEVREMLKYAGVVESAYTKGWNEGWNEALEDETAGLD